MCPEGCNLDGGGIGEHLRALGMFGHKEEKNEQIGLNWMFPSNIWRADTEGKSKETLLHGLKGQRVADAEEISV